MPRAIEDYALIGNTRTAALVGSNGSIDWLCLPRFDSEACFAALLGDASHGAWTLAPRGEYNSSRRYRPGTLVLETDFETASGAVRVVDCMPVSEGRNDVVRIVEGLRGRVDMRMEVCIRFGYGRTVPWVQWQDIGLTAVAGPDALALRSRVPLRGRDFTAGADFPVGEGQIVPFALTYYRSNDPTPLPIDPWAACALTTTWWRDWSARSTYDGGWADAVERSLLTLKALTYGPTGGIVAAPTTSLPELPGGVRNWDYRYCWVRDATFTLYAMLLAGYHTEAAQWREWLLRAAAGRPQDLQTIYGVAGERRLDEWDASWLPGYGGARPVRIGNAASRQFQLDVYGETLDMLHLARRSRLQPAEQAWDLQRVLLEFLESAWQDRDSGVWEMRGEAQHFVHSKVMAWVAFDRAVKAVERFGLEGPVERWRGVRGEIRREVLDRGVDPKRGVFVQAYGSSRLDANVLMIPLVGFLPVRDRRMLATLKAIRRELVRDGLVLRYGGGETIDGLPPGEGAFLPCSFWLVDNLAMLGQTREAEALFERLLCLRNDVGLLSEEYDPRGRRMLGNFPQAFTHVALINTARNLSRGGGPSEHRAQDTEASPEDT